MKFRDQLPQQLLENKYLDNLVTVLDGMEAYKRENVYRHTLFYKSIMCSSNDWIKKRLEDYGFPPFPDNLPKECLDALLLNARNIMSLKGSDRGLKIFLWCLTFGTIDINWDNFYPIVQNLTLSEFSGKGHLLKTDPSDVENVNYLFDKSEDLGEQYLFIGIATPYFDNPDVIDYITRYLSEFLGFTSNDFTLNLNMIEGPYVAIPEPYWYFVKPTDDDAIIINPDFGIEDYVIEDTFICL